MTDETAKEVSKERLIELLETTDDLTLTVAHKALTGKPSNEPLILTRAELENLIKTDDNIAFTSYHSSGITNAGNHSSN